MNPKLKLALYVVLVGCMAVFAYALYSIYNSPSTPAQPPDRSTNLAALTPQTNTSNQATATNAVATNVLTTNVIVTNVIAASSDDAPLRQSSPRMGRMMAYGVAMFFTLIGLSLLIAHDVSRYLANRVEDFIFNDNLDGIRDPEYEEAERTWASGQHLDAIQLMRDYLKKHPREQYVALRIAEIYENDLHNYLAAALEYEEVLKRKLPAERWGWAAIHLSNLYSGKLNKIEEATRLLRRIVDQYGQTAAAKKARERLGIPEPAAVTVAPLAPEPELTTEPQKPQAPSHNLPPGFRPKE